MDEGSEPRYFAVNSAGIAIDLMKTAEQQVVAEAETMLVFQRLGIEDRHVPALMQAWEIMKADRVPEGTIGQLLASCHRSGRDPVAFAKHFVMLRTSVR